MKSLEMSKSKKDTWNNKPMFKIVKVDDSGEELEKYSVVISMGTLKARYILEHLEALKEFVKENG